MSENPTTSVTAAFDATAVEIPDDEPRQIVCTGEDGSGVWQPGFGTWEHDDFGIDGEEPAGEGERLFVNRRIYDALLRELTVTRACNRGLVRLNEATQARAEQAETDAKDWARLSGAADIRATAAEARVEVLSAELEDARLFLDIAVSNAPEPLQELGAWLASHLDEDDWPTAERYLNAAATAHAVKGGGA